MWGAIDAAITRDEDGFAAGLVEFAHSCGAHARADHQIFVDLFRNGRIPGLWPSRAVRPGTTNSASRRESRRGNRAPTGE